MSARRRRASPSATQGRQRRRSRVEHELAFDAAGPRTATPQASLVSKGGRALRPRRSISRPKFADDSSGDEQAPSSGRTPRSSGAAARKDAPRAARNGATKKKKEKQGAEAKAVEVEYEFGGPIGATLIMLTLPVVVLGLQALARDGAWWTESQSLEVAVVAARDVVVSGVHDAVDVAAVSRAFLVVIAWLLFLVVLALILPGEDAQGTVLQEGGRLTYRLNGFASLVITTGVGTALQFVQPWGFDLAAIGDLLPSLAVATMGIAIVLSFYLYARSFSATTGIVAAADTGVIPYDFFMGRERNPRVFGGALDLKFFCELRPGIIGWGVLLVGLALAQRNNITDGGGITNSMWMVCAFQGLYIADSLWFEKAILTTMDITSDGFGWMLAFGDLAVVPFTYTLQAFYLVNNPVRLTTLSVVLISALNLLGYYLFRGANLQKDRFRTDPDGAAVRHLKVLHTKRGSRLIVSGIFWGIARHMNYFGDWLMGLSWCLCTGFDNPATYYYAIYFAILLLHRQGRDEHWCRTKYGDDWDRFCAIVRYRIIPFVY